MDKEQAKGDGLQLSGALKHGANLQKGDWDHSRCHHQGKEKKNEPKKPMGE